MNTWLNELVDITRGQYIWLVLIIPMVLMIFAYIIGKESEKSKQRKRYYYHQKSRYKNYKGVQKK